MKALLLYLLLFISCACSAQIVQTKEVQTAIEREIAHLKELHRAEMDAIKLALNLQAKEYERRLGELNHEAERLALMVPREEYEKFEERVNAELKSSRSWQDNMTGKLAVSVGIISIVLFALNYFKKKPEPIEARKGNA